MGRSVVRLHFPAPYILYTIILSLLFSSSAFAEWTEVSKNVDGSTYYVDFENIKKQVNAEIEITNALNNFAAIVSEGLLKCNYIPGVIKLIGELFNLNKRLFVVSGSDEKELIQVFRQRGIDHYFENIYGSPDNKIDNTKKVIKSNGRLSNGIFFGDSKADYEAASQYKMDFILINGATEWFNGNRVIDTKYVYNNFNRII